MDTLLSLLPILFLLFINKLNVCASDIQQEQQQEDKVAVVCKEEERKALLDFKQGIHDPYGLLSSWTGNNCCTNWKGVHCSTHSGHVVRLDLQGQEWYFERLGGEIRPSLLGLRHLRYLDLSMNHF